MTGADVSPMDGVSLRMKLATALFLALTASVVLALPVTSLGPGVNIGTPHAIAAALVALPFAVILHVSPAADGGFIVFFSDFGAIRSAQATSRLVWLGSGAVKSVRRVHETNMHDVF